MEICLCSTQFHLLHLLSLFIILTQQSRKMLCSNIDDNVNVSSWHTISFGYSCYTLLIIHSQQSMSLLYSNIVDNRKKYPFPPPFIGNTYQYLLFLHFFFFFCYSRSSTYGYRSHSHTSFWYCKKRRWSLWEEND